MYILYKTWTTVVTLKAQSWTWNYLARPQILPLSRLTVLTQAVNSPGWNKKAQANPFKTITRVGKGTKEWKLKCKKDQCHGLRTVWEWGGLKCRHGRRRNWVWTKASMTLNRIMKNCNLTWCGGTEHRRPDKDWMETHRLNTHRKVETPGGTADSNNHNATRKSKTKHNY